MRRSSVNGLKVGVVGLGKMGLLHAALLSVLPGVEVAALCERSGVVARFARRAFGGATVVRDVAGLTALGLDAVYVATSIPSHGSVVKAIYEGKVARSVFVEKTLASSYAEALCLESRAVGGVTMVGYQRRFGVTFRKALALLREGVVGEVERFRGYAYSSDFAGHVGEGKMASRGGVLRDLGSHALDLAMFFFGGLEVSSCSVGSSENGVSGSSYHVEAKASDGVFGEFDVSWSMEGYRLPEIGLVVEGGEGVLKVNDDWVELHGKGGRSSVWFRQGLDDSVGFLLGGPEFYREDELFVSCVREGRRPEVDFEAASRVDRLIDLAEHMAKAGPL